MAHSAFISGQWVSGGGGAMSSVDPATGDTVWTGESATPDSVAQAFHGARAAFADWALTSYETRRAVVEAYGEIVKAEADHIAELISRETGKPLWETNT